MEDKFCEVVPETEDEGSGEEGGGLCSSMIWRVTRRMNMGSDVVQSSRSEETTLTNQHEQFKRVSSEMEKFLSRYYFFDDHDDVRNSFSSFPSLLRNKDSHELEKYFKTTENSLQSHWMRPLRRHLRRGRQNFKNLEGAMKLLRCSRRKCLPQYVSQECDSDKAVLNGFPPNPTFKKDDRVRVCLDPFWNTPSCVVKRLRRGMYLVDVLKTTAHAEKTQRYRIPYPLLQIWTDNNDSPKISPTTLCVEHIVETDKSSQRILQEENVEQNRSYESTMLTVGTLVEVARRCWSNMNKPGGTGLITDVFVLRDDEETANSDEDNYHVKKGQCHNQSESGYDGTDKPTKYCYNIRYPIGGREKRVHQRYVTPTTFQDRTVKRRGMLGRCRVPNCPSFIADCGHTQPGQKIHSVTEKLVQRRSALLTEDNAKADFNKNILNVERLAKITTETKVKRKRLVPTKDAVHKKLSAAMATTKSARRARRKRLDTTPKDLDFFSHTFRNSRIISSNINNEDDENDSSLDYRMSNKQEKSHCSNKNKKNKIELVEERLFECEKLLGKLERENQAFEETFINKVRVWFQEATRNKKDVLQKNTYFNKMNEVDKDCKSSKIRIQRELNDALDRHFVYFDKISNRRTLPTQFELKVSRLEARDSAAQEEFKNLVMEQKRLQNYWRRHFGMDSVEIADSESSSSVDGVQHDTSDSSDEEKFLDGVLNEDNGDKLFIEDQHLANRPKKRRRKRRRGSQRVRKRSNKHSTIAQKYESSETSQNSDVSSPSIIVRWRKQSFQPSTDTYVSDNDSMGDFITDDEVYPSTKRKGVKMGQAIISDASIRDCKTSPQAHLHRDQHGSWLCCDKILQDLLGNLIKERISGSMKTLPCDLLFVLSPLDTFFILPQPCDYSKSILHSKCLTSFEQSQKSLELMLCDAKNEVDIQKGDVVVNVIREMFISLHDLFLEQVNEENTSAVFCLYLYNIDLLWTQYTWRNFDYCVIFFQECDHLESLIITSPLFHIKSCAVNLFTLLRRKALWLNVGRQYLSTIFENENVPPIEYVNISHLFHHVEEKLWAQIFAGLTFESNYDDLAAQLRKLVDSTASISSASYLNDIIICAMNLSGPHAVQLRQLQEFASTACLPEPGSCVCKELTWKEFNEKLTSFLTWAMKFPTNEHDRSRIFVDLHCDYDIFRQSASCPEKIFKFQTAGMIVRSKVGDFSAHSSLSMDKRLDQTVWFSVVMQSTIFFSLKPIAQFPVMSENFITPNWGLVNSLTTHVSSFRMCLPWISRVVALLSLWGTTTEGHVLFQMLLSKMLNSASTEQAISIYFPWNENCLRRLDMTALEEDQHNSNFDTSIEQLRRCRALEDFVKKLSQDETEFNFRQGLISIRMYDEIYIDQLLRLFFALYDYEIPRLNILPFSAAFDFSSFDFRRPFGKDCFVPAVLCFDALLCKVQENVGESEIEFKRLKSRIVRPVTGVLKLFVENMSFSTGIISLYQARICLEKFGANDVFGKLCLSRTFKFLDSIGCDYESLNMTKKEHELLLWFAIITVYLPLVTTSIGNYLKLSERKECYNIICGGFEQVWTEIRDQAIFKPGMLNQNIASGAVVIISSLVLYNSFCLSESEAPSGFVEDDGTFLKDTLQKIMDNIFNGLQLKQNIVNEACLRLLQRIAFDLFHSFRNAFLSSATPRKECYHLVDIFLDEQFQVRLQRSLQRLLLTLVKEVTPEGHFSRKMDEFRLDNTLSSVPNLSSNSNNCWRQSLEIVSFASTLYLSVVVIELQILTTPQSVNLKGRLPALRKMKSSIVSLFLEGFHSSMDEDEVTAVDIWLKCAFWSKVFSIFLNFLEVTTAGKKREILTRLLNQSAIDASDLFAIWLGTISTACLQPNILLEIGLASLHKALHSDTILQYVPVNKGSLVVSCFQRLVALRTSELMRNENSDFDVDRLLKLLSTFSLVLAVQLNEIPPAERSIVKEGEVKPMLDVLHRCLKSLEDRIKYTSSSMRHVLKRVICVITGQVLGGILSFASPENSLIYLFNSYPLVDLIEFSSYSSGIPKLEVCLLLRMLPLYVAGISFTKYSTTFFSTWTPLLSMLPSCRVASLRAVRAFATHLWACSLVFPFDNAAFESIAASNMPSAQWKEVFKDACSVVVEVPSLLLMADGERLEVPNAEYAPHSKYPRGYVSNINDVAHRMSNHYTSINSFLSFHEMWKKRMRGFCEYVLCNEALWEGKGNQQWSGVGHAAQRCKAVAARIDLIIEILKIVSNKDLHRNCCIIDDSLLLVLCRHLMLISVIFCGRLKRYFIGDNLSDIISEEVDVPSSTSNDDLRLVEDCAYNLYLCHREVSNRLDHAETLNFHGMANVTAKEYKNWKCVLRAFCQAVSRSDRGSLDQAEYHSCVMSYIKIVKGCDCTFHSFTMLVEEIQRHEEMSQSQSSASTLTLRRSYSGQFIKTLAITEKALVATDED